MTRLVIYKVNNENPVSSYIAIGSEKNTQTLEYISEFKVFDHCWNANDRFVALTEEVKALKETNVDLNHEIDELKETNKELIHNADLMDSYIEDLEDDVGDLKFELNVLKEANLKLRNQILNLGAQIKNTNGVLDKLRKPHEDRNMNTTK